jgi:hypothetical protein
MEDIYVLMVVIIFILMFTKAEYYNKPRNPNPRKVVNPGHVVPRHPSTGGKINGKKQPRCLSRKIRWRRGRPTLTMYGRANPNCSG